MFTSLIAAATLSCVAFTGPATESASSEIAGIRSSDSIGLENSGTSSHRTRATASRRSVSTLPTVNFVQVEAAFSERACEFAQEVLDQAGAGDSITILPRKDIDTVVVIGTWGAADLAEQALSHAVFALRCAATSEAPAAVDIDKDADKNPDTGAAAETAPTRESSRTDARNHVSPDPKNRLAEVARLRNDPNLSEAERNQLALEFRQLLNRIRKNN